MFPTVTEWTDLHSHLVPGVDDGARTLEEALEGLQRLWDEGVRRVVTTPHLNGSLTLSPEALEIRLDEIDPAWETLRGAALEALPDLELQRGHEVMLDVPDPDLSDPRVRLAGTSFVLVEWPRLQVPPGTGRVLRRLVDSGIKPIIAHPERYQGLSSEDHLPGEWREAGALLQVNYGPLAGRYGNAPQARARSLLERGWVDLLATDFHGRSHLPLYLQEARDVLQEMGGDEQYNLLTQVNPAWIYRGDDPLPVPPLAAKKGAWARLRASLLGKNKR